MRGSAFVISLLLLAGCTTPAPTPSVAPTTPGQAPTIDLPTGAPMPTEPLAVYFTANDRGEPKLVREFHMTSASAAADRVKTAVSVMLDGRNALDPDYASLFPASSRVLGVRTEGTTAFVDLGGSASNPLGAKASQIAVQQIVWTATAVKGVEAVRIILDGKQVNDLWGHVDVSKPLKRAPAVDVLYQVWLISPQHGDATGRDVTIHIAGIVFEATVNWEVLKGSTVVKKGFMTLSAGPPSQGEGKATVKLEPGTYKIVAFWISPNDSSRQSPDDHVITVR